MTTKRIWPGDINNGEIQIIDEYKKPVYQNKWIQVFNDRVVSPNDGKRGRYIRIKYANRPKGVVLVPIIDRETDDGRKITKIVMVYTFRHSPRVWMWELPRSFGEPGEENRITMKREILEETGYEVDLSDQYPLGHLVPDSGKLQDIPLLLVTRVREKETPRPESLEAIRQVEEFPLSKIRLRCQTGHIIDMFTLAALTRLEPHFQNDLFSFDRKLANNTPLNETMDFQHFDDGKEH